MKTNPGFPRMYMQEVTEYDVTNITEKYDNG